MKTHQPVSQNETLSHGCKPLILTHEWPEDRGALPDICDGETSHKCDGETSQERGLVSLADKETSHSC